MDYSEKLKDPRWQKKRLEILQRDFFSCRFCGDDKNTLHIHHIAYNDGEPWEIENKLLMTLCEPCHKEEQAQIKIEINNLITALKNEGFTASAFSCAYQLFGKDRNWAFDDTEAFGVLRMIIEDDDLWDEMHGLFMKRLRIKLTKNNKQQIRF